VSRSWLRLLAPLACGIALAEPLLATTEAVAGPREEARVVLRMINGTRRARHVRALRPSRRASRVAQRHSRKMARRGDVFHPRNLPRAIDDLHWSRWGDNVACGRSLKHVHRKLMDSRDSRRNLLYRRFDHVGIGVAESRARPRVCRGATFWVTQIFYG
jgi:uncharacterized protein YkwD